MDERESYIVMPLRKLELKHLAVTAGLLVLEDEAAHEIRLANVKHQLSAHHVISAQDWDMTCFKPLTSVGSTGIEAALPAAGFR